MVNDLELEDEEESTTEDTSSEHVDAEPEAEHVEPEGAQSVFKAPKLRPRYKTTPLGTHSTSANQAGQSPKDSGQNTPRTPGSGAAAIISPRTLAPAAPQRQILRQPLPVSGTSSGDGKSEAAVR